MPSLPRADRLFSSVFPPSGFADVWPISTHHTDTSYASPSLRDHDTGLGPSIDPNRSEKRSHAWETATRFLRLFTVTGAHTKGRTENDEGGGILWEGRPHITRDVQYALSYLFFGEGVAFAEAGEENLLDWYINMALEHYHNVVLPAVKELWPSELTEENSWEFVSRLAAQLHAAQQSYILPFSSHLVPVFDPQPGRQLSDPSAWQSFTWILGRLRRDILAACVHSIPKELMAQALGFIVLDTGRRLFYIHPKADENGNLEPHDQEMARHVRSSLLTFLEQLQVVGLAGDRVSGTVATAISQLLDEFVASHHMKVDWQSQQSVVPFLREWVRSAYIPFMQEVVTRIDVQEVSVIQDFTARKCEEMAVCSLGRARTAKLFDYVLRSNQSMSAMADLKEYLPLPGARFHLTTALAQQLQSRLLHHGSSASHILDFYVYIIRTFCKLDPKGVLLDRVSRPLRRYLRTRPDTVRIIISSLLASREDLELVSQRDKVPSGSHPNISVEVTKEMIASPVTPAVTRVVELDWENMNWTPDPVDAGPEYRRRSKSDDCLTAILTLYDSDDFVTELGSVFGETLLRYAPGQPPSDYEREMRVLEMFKRRIGLDKLQSCEVMLHDTLESRRLNRSIATIIKRKLEDPNVKQNTSRPKLKAQVLSRFFWPALREDSFSLPPPVQEARDAYSEVFNSLKKDRELQWFSSLGLAQVELELTDRQWKGECQTWQASVIYSFGDDLAQPPSTLNDPNFGASQTVEAISANLGMEEMLVLNALAFWQAHDVLVETEHRTWAVQERLRADRARDGKGGSKGKALQGPVISAVKKADDIWNDNKPMYKQFILGFISNRGRSLNELYRLLQMSVEEGFNYPKEHVGSLLAEMEEGKEVSRIGDKYRAVKDG